MGVYGILLRFKTERVQLICSTFFQNGARSRCRWSVSGGRACATLRVNITDSLMAHPNAARRRPRLLGKRSGCGFQLPLLLKLFCNYQSCGHQQVDMLSLLLGRSRPGRRLVKVFSASLVRIRPRRHIATRRGAGKTHRKHGRSIGHAAMVRRSRTGHVVDMFTGRTQRHVARALALGRLLAGRPSYSSGWRIEVTVGPYWLLAPNG